MAKAPAWTLTSLEDISQFMERREMSALDFAKLVGVSNSTFHNWKRGKSVPRAHKQEIILRRMEGADSALPDRAVDGSILHLIRASSGQSTGGRGAQKLTKQGKPRKKPGPKPKRDLIANTAETVLSALESIGVRESSTCDGWAAVVVRSYLENNKLGENLASLEATLAVCARALQPL